MAVAVMHLVLFRMLVLDLMNNLGFDYNSIFDEYPFYVDILVAGFLMVSFITPTFLTCLIIFPTDKNNSVSNFSLAKTLLGDFIISFSAFVFISIYWDNLIALVAGELSNEPVGLKTFAVILFFFIFLMIYLPPRLIFLISDYNKIFTWVRIIVVFIPFVTAAY